MVRILRGFATVWVGAVGLLVLIGIVGRVWTASSFVEGVSEVMSWFSPFNIWNWVLTLLSLSPALGAHWIAGRLEKRK